MTPNVDVSPLQQGRGERGVRAGWSLPQPGIGLAVSAAWLLLLAGLSTVVRPALAPLTVLVLLLSSLGASPSAARPLPIASPVAAGAVDARPIQSTPGGVADRLARVPPIAAPIDVSPVVQPATPPAAAARRPAAGAGATSTATGTTATGTTAGAPPPAVGICPPTPAPIANRGGGELLGAPWTLRVQPPAASTECYQAIAPPALVNHTGVRVTFDTHGTAFLGGDASAVVFDDGSNDSCFNGPGCRWHFASLANYGRNGFDGRQTVTIPLAAFPGLHLSQPVNGTFHVRFWNDAGFRVDILSVVVV